MTEKELVSKITAFLSKRTSLTLASVGSDGDPAAAAVFFAADSQLNLYFLAARTTQHGDNMLRHPKVAVTIYADNQDPAVIMGVQMRGEARPATALQLPKAAAVYAAKFAFASRLDISRRDEIAGVLSTAGFWKFTPDWVRLTDNSLGFGHKEEISLDAYLAEDRKKENEIRSLVEENLRERPPAAPPEHICHRKSGHHHHHD